MLEKLGFLVQWLKVAWRRFQQTSLRSSPAKSVVFAGCAVPLTIMLAGCASMSGVHWPWGHKPPPPPQQVHDLALTGEAGAPAAFPQYLERNTVVVDLQGVSGSGRVTVKPRGDLPWPVRLAFRVTPGSIGALEVRADQRTVLPVTATGGKPVQLELEPGIYTPRTRQLTVSWGPNPAPVP